MTHIADLERSLSAMSIDDRDTACVTLARQLASSLDLGEEPLKDLAPKYLAVLRALQLTPDSRKAVKDDGDDESEQALREATEGTAAG